MRPGKCADTVHTACHLTANRIKPLKPSAALLLASLNFGHNVAESVERLRGLRIEAYVAGQVYAVKICHVAYHDGASAGLPHKSVDLGMTRLPVYQYQRLAYRHSVSPGPACQADLSGIGRHLDATLQLQHHRTSGIDNLNVVAACHLISGRRLAVGTQQYLHVMQVLKVGMCDSDQPLAAQTLHLGCIMHDIAQTVEASGLIEFLLRLAYGRDHTEAET